MSEECKDSAPIQFAELARVNTTSCDEQYTWLLDAMWKEYQQAAQAASARAEDLRANYYLGVAQGIHDALEHYKNIQIIGGVL